MLSKENYRSNFLVSSLFIIVIIETCVIKFLKTIRLTITFVIHGIPNSLTNLPILNNKSKLTHEITILLSFIKKTLKVT